MNINARVGATLRVALRISGTSTPGRNPAATCGTPFNNMFVATEVCCVNSHTMFVDAEVCSVNSHTMFVDAARCSVNSNTMFVDAVVCGVNSDDVGSVPRPEKALPYGYGHP